MSLLKDRQWYIKIIQGEECLNCDRPKKKGFAFCYSCHRKLPAELQRNLYRPIGKGFEQAFEEAIKFLEP